MSKTPDAPPVIEATIPSAQGISAIASANAPFIYFENVPAFAIMNGIGHVTLEAGRLLGSGPDGKVLTDRVLVAHLRGNLLAMKGLRAALDRIILMAEPRPEGPAN